MTAPILPWPYLPTLLRLALALAVGLFVGIERERRRKEAGLRTFGFVALLGGIGGLVGGEFALLALGLVGVLVVLLNVETIRTGEGAEITTSAALLIVGFAGMLAGEGHTFTPTALGVATAALLAWKEPLAGFSQTLTESELRSAVLLAILTFVVFPVLPHASIDRWNLIQPREAWLTVLLIAALGFVNYILLKRYGARGVGFTGFFGGLVNSTVTVTELASRAKNAPSLVPLVYRGVVLATAAMLLRNAVILGILAPQSLVTVVLPIGTMFIAATLIALVRAPLKDGSDSTDDVLSKLESPFSLAAALKFGAIFLLLQVGATLAQRTFGHVGFYTVSIVGGIVSSASAVASAAALSASGVLPPHVAGTGALLATFSSALIDIPLTRIAQDRALTKRVAIALLLIAIVGTLVAIGQFMIMP